MSSTGTASTSATRGGARKTLTVALTGASGTVGPALLDRLEASREVGRVVVLGRHCTDQMRDHAKLEFRQGDVRDERAVHESVAGADVVVHLAFSLYGVLLGETELFETNVRGTANVAHAAAQTGAARFVYASSAAVYGRGGEESHPLDEEAEMHAPTRLFYARHKAQAELVVRELLEASSTDVFIFRPCAIVGPHAVGALAHRVRHSALERGRTLLTAMARVGLRPMLLPPPVPLQFLHEDDVAQAIAIAVAGQAPGGVYNLAGEGVLSGEETVRALGFRAAPVPSVAVDALLEAVARVPPLVPAIGWPELVHEPLLVDTTKAREQLGWEPRFSSEEALLETRKAIGW